MRNSSVRLFAAIAGLAALLAACGQRVEIHNVARHVEGFELIDADGEGFFGRLYAIGANYPYFVYRNETYERAGSGAVVIRRGEARSTEFVVREEVVERDKRGNVTRSRLTIANKESGEILGWRYLRDGEIEDGHGWVGAHAVKFVQQVLIRDSPVGGAAGIKPYPTLDTRIEVLPPTGMDIQYFSTSNCPSDFTFEGFPKTLVTASWRFLPPAPIAAVTCAGDFVVVASNSFPDSAYVDVLSKDGRSLAQSALKVAVPTEAFLARIDNLAFESDAMVFDLNYGIWIHEKDMSRRSPYQTHRVHLHWINGAKRASSELEKVMNDPKRLRSYLVRI
jgi:hypothetical protein